MTHRGTRQEHRQRVPEPPCERSVEASATTQKTRRGSRRAGGIVTAQTRHSRMSLPPATEVPADGRFRLGFTTAIHYWVRASVDGTGARMLTYSPKSLPRLATGEAGIAQSDGIEIAALFERKRTEKLLVWAFYPVATS